MLICVTGASGSGKSYIALMLSEMDDNIVSLDIDKIGHLSLRDMTIKSRLVEAFGTGIITDTEVDRKKLGPIVFNSTDNMEKLKEITWPFMKDRINEFIDDNARKTVVLDYIALPETEYFDKSDIRILVDIDYETRLRRAVKRDFITKEAFDVREKARYSYDGYEFDYVIDNSDFEKTKEKVKSIYGKSIVSR